ncbi:MAG: 2-amino-4-hydroxy-6-hydroxymethyldihydropteridine diphosphokinase [candidate division Zixibacteria bacterium]|nr:2-amino-4-hydroxy-6-hydroxymethyldihydropteridine diphosphokinase [candidate division Zixibacteria bacterium]
MNEYIYILMGSNLGSRADNLFEAANLLGSIKNFEIVRSSAIYTSLAKGMAPGTPDFLNQALECRYPGSPQELLEETEKIERLMGRIKKSDYASRIIDIDILLFGREIISGTELNVPHPRLTERAFALIPLLELNCRMLNPMTDEPYQKCLNRLDTKPLPERYEFTVQS